MHAQFRQVRAAAISVIMLLLFPFCAEAKKLDLIPMPHEVILFENADYDGEAIRFSYDNDVDDLTKWNLLGERKGKWNDKISSVKIGKDTRVTLFEHVGYGGASITFEGDGEDDYYIPDLHSIGWGDIISSLKIRRTAVPEPNQAILFEHVNYDGEALYLEAGQEFSDLREAGMQGGKTWNDKISSIKIGKNAKVLLCDDIGYGGTRIPLEADGQWIKNIPTLHPEGWGDRVSSLKVRMLNEDWELENKLPKRAGSTRHDIGDPPYYKVYLFEDENHEGEYLQYSYSNDVPDLSKLNLHSGYNWNDRIRSLKLGSKTRITLYQYANFGGASISFQGDGDNVNEIPHLDMWGWGDMVSSFKVRPVANPEANQVFLFEHENYDGAALILKIGENLSDLRKLEISSGKTWNDKISSIKIGKDAMVRVWTDINYTGISQLYPKKNEKGYVSYTSLHGEGWGDKISSLEVLDRVSTFRAGHSEKPKEPQAEQYEDGKNIVPKPGEVIFWEKEGFQGARIWYEFDSEVTDLSKLIMRDSENWNDKISSFKLGSNAKVFLYEDVGCGDGLFIGFEGKEGKGVEYPSLHWIGWGDRISSFKVLESGK